VGTEAKDLPSATRIWVIVCPEYWVSGPDWMAWGQEVVASGADRSRSRVITGCTLGSLRPCGCSGGQLGGAGEKGGHPP